MGLGISVFLLHVGVSLAANMKSFISTEQSGYRLAAPFIGSLYLL